MNPHGSAVAVDVVEQLAGVGLVEDVVVAVDGRAGAVGEEPSRVQVAGRGQLEEDATANLRMALGNSSNIKWCDGMGRYVIDWGPG